MKKQKNKLLTEIICLSILLLLLSSSVVSSVSIQTSSVIENNQKEQEPLWGATWLDVNVKEEYGDPEDPQYRNLPNVTVYFWQFFRLIIPWIYYCKLISPIAKENIFSITAIEKEKTNKYGNTGVGDYSWTPLLLVLVEKEGYEVLDGRPFKSDRPLCCDPYPCLKFVMIKSENQNRYETTPIFNDDVKIIKGKISNLTDHTRGYSLPWYTFNCEDVYCILSFRDRPLIQHFVDKEQFTIAPFLFYGSITKSSINGFVRPWFWLNF